MGLGSLCATVRQAMVRHNSILREYTMATFTRRRSNIRNLYKRGPCFTSIFHVLIFLFVWLCLSVIFFAHLGGSSLPSGGALLATHPAKQIITNIPTVGPPGLAWRRRRSRAWAPPPPLRRFHAVSPRPLHRTGSGHTRFGYHHGTRRPATLFELES